MEPPSKKPRRRLNDAGNDSGNDDDGGNERPEWRGRGPLSRLRAQLAGVSDRHLQARLLVRYSDHAIAPDAETEAAIDFLFAFLQQNQTAGKDEGAGGSSAVVVGAIVRGLRRLLHAKPRVVEPMIQLDAMGEQLVHCISVPEDFKLRHGMLRIVLDCLVLAAKHADAERLLRTCLRDHDHKLQAIALRGIARLLASGYRLNEATGIELHRDLMRRLQSGPDGAVGVETIRLLVAVTIALERPPTGSDEEEPCDSTALALAACASHSPCWRLRRETAIALRRLVDHDPDAARHLLHKIQVDETSADAAKTATAMMSSGALLTLLEDPVVDVVFEALKTTRVIVRSSAWLTEFTHRVFAALVEMLSRVGTSAPELTLVALETAEEMLQIRCRDGDQQPEHSLSEEEVDHLIGSVSDHHPLTLVALLRVLSLCEHSNEYMTVRIATIACKLASLEDTTGDSRARQLHRSLMRDVPQGPRRYPADNREQLLLPSKSANSSPNDATVPNMDKLRSVAGNFKDAAHMATLLKQPRAEIIMAPRTNDTREVNSHVPLVVTVRFRLYHIRSLDNIFVKMSLPGEECKVKPIDIRECVMLRRWAYEGQATMLHLFSPFSDPQVVSVGICRQNKPVPAQTVTYEDLSPPSMLTVFHKPLPRLSGRQG